jgi:hypothetical protein
VGTISAVDVFLGAVLKISTIQYNKGSWERWKIILYLLSNNLILLSGVYYPLYLIILLTFILSDY